MCGVAGRFSPDRLPDAGDWHKRADTLLAHRGPDGSGHFADERCELVHRRLALIDLSATGRQPMTNETGDIQIVFNGEIYNHRALRAGLEARGHVFRSTSDTEVLIHLYEERGPHLVKLLRGIFAFAIYDSQRRRLVLARDRFGVKPMFYAMAAAGQLVFASEMKAITAFPGFTPQIDRQACCDFLGLGYIPEPATGFANIHALPQGSLLIAAPEGPRIETYYTVSAQPELDMSIDQTVDTLAQRLLSSVKAQAEADVPVAALLSGGIDSSLVVAAHRLGTGEQTNTFNVRFPDRSHDETPAALSVANHLRTAHQVIELRDYALTADGLLGIIRHFDQPFADTSCIPMYWVSQAIRDHGIICALSGDGGDEAFGGYQRFWRANGLARLMNMPGWTRALARRAGKMLASRTRDIGRQIAKAVEFADEGREDSANLLSGLSNYLTEDQKRDLLLPPADAFLPVARHFNGYRPAGIRNLEELSRRMTETLFTIGLPSDMLRKVDMMSMRASIEVRVPLLDEDVVGLGLRLPHRLKTDGREGKLVLRALAKRWLPSEIAGHKKHGFAIPLDVMATREVHSMVDDYLLGNEAATSWFLNRALVRDWVRKFRDATEGKTGGSISREGLYRRVFTLLSLEVWMRDHQLAW